MNTLAAPTSLPMSCFVRDEDAPAGVERYFLDLPHLPVTQSFYFVNDPLDATGRWLWFYYSRDLATRMLGVVDLSDGEVHLTEEVFLDASPVVDPRTGAAYYFQDETLYRYDVRQRRREFIAQTPAELRTGQRGKRIATHLTWRADGQALNFDAHYGRSWHAGDITLADGRFTLWRSFDRCYNHAQFSPTDPDLQLIAQDGWIDLQTGEHFDYDQRMWLLRRDGACTPLYDQPTPLHGHEWWDPTGAAVWYVHYGVGIKRYHLTTRQTDLMLPGEFSHAWSSRDGRWLITDQNVNPPDAPKRWQVRCWDLHTDRALTLADDLSQMSCHVALHLHPHPRLTANDRWTCFTLLRGGRATLALVDMQTLAWES